MNINIEEKITEILNTLKGYFLYAERGGSNCIPFIKNKHDYDLFIVSQNKEDRLKSMSLYWKTFNVKELIHTDGLDVHFILQEYGDKYLLENPFFTHVFKNNLLTDYKEAENKSIEDILNNQKETIKALKNKILSVYTVDNDRKYRHKIWYRVYLTLCIYKNKSFDLTEEQIENINILHDRAEKDLTKRIELIDEIIEEIKLWQT